MDMGFMSPLCTHRLNWFIIDLITCNTCHPAKTRRALNSDTMVGQRRRRWPNIETSLGRCLVISDSLAYKRDKCTSIVFFHTSGFASEVDDKLPTGHTTLMRRNQRRH